MAKTPKTEKRARPAATTRRASKPTKVTVKAEATPVKTETCASKPAAVTRTRTKTETKPKLLPAKFKVKAETKPAVKAEDQQAKRVSRFGGRDLFSRLQITKALGGNPRAAPFVKAASKYLAGQHYIVENPAWAPFAPAAAGAAGALRKHVVEWWERGEEGIAAGRALDMFCKRSEAPALYEYVGKYAPVPAGEIVERESAAASPPSAARRSTTASSTSTSRPSAPTRSSTARTRGSSGPSSSSPTTRASTRRSSARPTK